MEKEELIQYLNDLVIKYTTISQSSVKSIYWTGTIFSYDSNEKRNEYKDKAQIEIINMSNASTHYIQTKNSFLFWCDLRNYVYVDGKIEVDDILYQSVENPFDFQVSQYDKIIKITDLTKKSAQRTIVDYTSIIKEFLDRVNNDEMFILKQNRVEMNTYFFNSTIKPTLQDLNDVIKYINNQSDEYVSDNIFEDEKAFDEFNNEVNEFREEKAIITQEKGYINIDRTSSFKSVCTQERYLSSQIALAKEEYSKLVRSFNITSKDRFDHIKIALGM